MTRAIDRDFLISVINSLLPEGKGVALGKVAIAYEIIDRDPDIELAPRSCRHAARSVDLRDVQIAARHADPRTHALRPSTQEP
jgi:hypothetical protein